MRNLRNPLPAVEDAGGAAMDQIKKAASGVAQSAKEVTDQLEEWAKDGYGSAREVVKTKPFMWSAASLGFGALIGGLFALWRRKDSKGRSARRTMPVRARGRHMRAAASANGATSPSEKKKARKTKRPHPHQTASV